MRKGLPKGNAIMGAVKVNPDGSITVASLQEALELQGLILARQQEAKPLVRKRVLLRGERANGEHSSNEVVRAAHDAIGALAAHSGKKITSDQLAKVLGLDTPTAIGPKMRHLRAALKQEGLSLDDYLQGKKEGRNPRMWSVK
jgi:hypothetical protein